MKAPTIITLTTDFGLRDGNVGVMKGVIWGIAPGVHIVDISHAVSPQNIFEVAFILGRSASYFPAGTVHVAVVDPGVGTTRRPLTASLGGQFFVGPDNGLCTILLQHAEREGQPVEMVHLDQPKYWLPEVSNVFHGRDIFSPVAAHLANGLALHELGTPLTDPVRLELPEPKCTSQGWVGQVIYIDHFGNVISNITRHHLEGQTISRVRLGGIEIQGMVRTFGDRPPGEVISLFGSTGNLIVSVVNGNASDTLGVSLHDPVEVLLKIPPHLR